MDKETDRYLKPAKDDSLPDTIIFVDTETYQDKNNIHKLRIGYLEVWVKRKLIHTSFFETVEEFHKLIIKYKKQIWVIAHNWDFDANVLHMQRYYGDKILLSKSIIDSNAPFKLFIKDTDKEIILLDSTNWFNTTLEKIGISLGFNKLKMPKLTETNLEKWKPYVKRDVEVLSKACWNLWEYMEELGTNNIGFTAAMTAFNYYRSKHMKKDSIKIHRIPEVIDHERKSYFGGRVDSFYRGVPSTDVERLYKYDFNSLYPAMMIGQMPARYGGKMDKPSVKKLMFLINQKGVIPCATVKLKTNKEYYPYRDEETRKLIFPIGEFTTTLWEPELILAVLNEHIVEVVELHYYKTDNIFDSYVNTLYDKRLQYKEENNEAFGMVIKLLLNSLYGKFAQTRKTPWKLSDFVPTDESPGFYMRNGEVLKYITIGMNTWERKDDKINEFIGYSVNSIPQIAGYITSKARKTLIDAIEDCEGYVYYVDTDSIITDNKIVGPNVHDSKLGYLKLEETSAPEDCNFMAPKHYTFNGKAKIKGVTKALLNEDSYIQNRVSKFRTNVRQGKIEDGPEWTVIEKLVRGDNLKRLVIKENAPTIPIKITQLEEASVRVI